MQDSIRSQGVSIEGNLFSASNEGELVGITHAPQGHSQSMGSEIPQNYLTAQGENIG